MCRGILTFADKRELGGRYMEPGLCPRTLQYLMFSCSMLSFTFTRTTTAKGFEWLKIHVANLAGEDKVSLCQRCEYTEQHIEQVRPLLLRLK